MGVHNGPEAAERLEYLIFSNVGKSILIAGDFNGGRQSGMSRKIDRLWDGLWERMADLGLRDVIHETRTSRPRLLNCHCKLDDCGHVQTVRLRNSTKPSQLDHVFVTEALWPRVRQCRVHDHESALAISDHCPISVDLE